MSRSFASRVSNPRLKWVILVFWLVLAAVAAPLAGRLTGVQNNEISSWLPGDAESTLALEQQRALGSDPDVIPAVVVYERTAGLTSADLAAVTADGKAFARLDGVEGPAVGPFPSQDGQAAQVVVPINVGSGGWDAIAPLVDKIRTEARNGP